MQDDVRFMLDNGMMRNAPGVNAIVIPQAMER